MSALALKELTIEKEYLINTLNIIKRIIESKEANVADSKEQINDLKQYLWENKSMMDKEEINLNLDTINIGVDITNLDIKLIHNMKNSINNPYFGRIDFNDDEKNTIYIGINSVNEKYNYYVYDWRAPVSSLFYNYGIGNAKYDSPSGEIEGNISLKRQYKIVDGQLVRCINSELNIDDDYLQEILSQASTEKMTNIVNSIQIEQNSIIRNVSDKYLIVQGVAGSGKTSVALHRIAYLLYADKNLTSNNILILSPSNVFSEYISDVLPELGEQNVMETTFSEFSTAFLKKYKSTESFVNFVANFYKCDLSNEIIKDIKYKQSKSFEISLQQFFKEFHQNLLFKDDVEINETIFKKEELTELLKTKLCKLSVKEKLEYIAEKISLATGHKSQSFIDKTYNNLITHLSINLNEIEVYNQFLRMQGLKDCDYLYDSKSVKYEDILPLLYITFELNGYPYSNVMRHIIIDEVQDYSVLQLKLMKRIFKKSTFTLLGDVNQTINPYFKYNSLNEINEIFAGEGKYLELSKTYRSSQEIIDYTNEILNIKNVCAIRHLNNNPVIEKSIENGKLKMEIEKDIKIMQEKGYQKIAIITKNENECKKIAKLIDNLIPTIYTENIKISKEQHIIIIPAYLSKGLEFDSVIIYTDNDDKYSLKDCYLYYVACTRAQHDLVIYNQSKKLLKK